MVKSFRKEAMQKLRKRRVKIDRVISNQDRLGKISGP